LGLSLGAQARHPEAEAAYRRAIALKDDHPQAHCGLGIALVGQYRYKETEAAFRRAIQLKEDYPEAHCNLGDVLKRQGQFAAAVAPLKRGHELGSKNPRWPYPSARWLQEAERLLALDRKLPAILKRKAQPADARERSALAQLCYYKRLYAASARFYADAFAAEPRLADDSRDPHRYDAACSAALAAAGKGADAAQLDDGSRARLRGQALAWLRADLRTWAARVEKGTPQEQAEAAKSLRHWQTDPDLAGVRDAAALAGLPQTERADWQRLWADVQALLEKAGGKGTQGR
jgi:tetratricopeptide (TPR) repeat protein